MEKRPYYEAYDDRYRQVHREKLEWFTRTPSPIVEQTIREYQLGTNSRILELGCGEGRDAIHLLRIASTSCRMVDFPTFQKELEKNGLTIIKQGITAIQPEFSQIMYAVVR